MISELTDSRRERLTELARERTAALRMAAPRILQVSLAAGVAWVIARYVVGNHNPFFAPAAVVVTLGLTIGQRGRRMFELALGVSIGIGIASGLVFLIGAGTWQLVVMLCLVMSASVLAGGSPMLVNQASVSAVLVVTVQAANANAAGDRFVDALIGSAVALAANAITPVNPIRMVLSEVDPLLERLSRALGTMADSLEQGRRELAVQGLDAARRLDPAARELKAAVVAGTETTRIAPTRWQQRGRLEVFAHAAEQIDLAIRNSRVLARACVRAIDLDEHVPPNVVESIRDLAAAVRALDRHLASPDPGSPAREAALRAAARSSAALEETSNLSVSVIVGQVRSTATDLLVGMGVERPEAREAVRAARERLDI